MGRCEYEHAPCLTKILRALRARRGETRGTGLAYMGALQRVTSRAHGERRASDRTLPLDTQVVTIIDRRSYVDPLHRMDIH
jgi:hypothetical protein